MSKDNITQNMTNKIYRANDIKSFIKENEENFISNTFYDYLNSLLVKKGLKVSEVHTKTRLSKTYIYQIFNKKKNPSRNNIIQIALAMSCTLAQTQNLLKLSNLGQLYSRNKRDSIIIYGIVKNFSRDDIEILLTSLNQEIL